MNTNKILSGNLSKRSDLDKLNIASDLIRTNIRYIKPTSFKDLNFPFSNQDSVEKCYSLIQKAWIEALRINMINNRRKWRFIRYIFGDPKRELYELRKTGIRYRSFTHFVGIENVNTIENIPKRDREFVYWLGEYNDTKNLIKKILIIGNLLLMDWNKLGLPSIKITSINEVNKRITHFLESIVAIQDSVNDDISHEIRTQLRALSHLYMISIASNPLDKDINKKIYTGQIFDYWQRKLDKIRGKNRTSVQIPLKLKKEANLILQKWKIL